MAIGCGEDAVDDSAHDLDCAVEVMDQEEEPTSGGLDHFDYDGTCLTGERSGQELTRISNSSSASLSQLPQ